MYDRYNRYDILTQPAVCVNLPRLSTSVVLGESLLVFSGQKVWRYSSTGYTHSFTRGANINRMYPFGRHVESLDHVYATEPNQLTMIVGSEMWRFDGGSLMPGYPKRLSSVGLPDNLPLETEFRSVPSRNLTYAHLPNTEVYELDENYGGILRAYYAKRL